MKRILDYKGGVFLRPINNHVWLLNRQLRLVEILERELDLNAGEDWSGRLHIIVEVEEDSDPHP